MNDVRAITPNSWPDLISELYADDWDDSIRRHRSTYAFRGAANAKWDMPTSLMRLGGDFAKIERHLLRNFRKYAHRDVVERDSFWHWLIAAQHHGLPTRLLDWTYSPFVSLHFATENLSRMGEDGAVWCVNIDQIHKELPPFFKTFLNKEGSYVFTVDMLTQLELPEVNLEVFGVKLSSSTLFPNKIVSLSDFDRTSKEPFALFFEPPSIDDRIVNQFALFSAISNPTVRFDFLISKHLNACKKVIVKSALKWEVRDRLDQANITERVLFPGLDGLSKWLTRHYSPSS